MAAPAAGLDEAGFVGRDHCLYSVANGEFAEDRGDVRLDGCFAEVELPIWRSSE